MSSVALVAMLGIIATVSAAGGFDEFGYNDTARIFNGPADGVDKVLDGNVWGDPTYANDRVVMKWNAAWDACNDAGGNNASVCTGAWTDNEWNGNVPGGSQTGVWHYKIVWVGPCGSYGTPLPDGGYCIWNNYEMLMSHGSDAGHLWDAHAIPNGYGGH
ncbi:MAG: hypothetical protein Q7T54_02330 [Candidatus Levybacteria bacterium]|nr:hypothetical protein [Candidatus Levybacteria bacterium]